MNAKVLAGAAARVLEKGEVEIEHVEIDEQLLFRCQGRPLVNLREAEPAVPPAEGKAAPKRPAAKGQPGDKSAVPKKAAAPPPGDQGSAAKKAAAAPSPAAPAKDGKEADGQKSAAAKAAKPKSKANDAYQPQATDWFANPFADQPISKKK